MCNRCFLAILGMQLLTGPVGADVTAELKPFQGEWEVVELVEDGQAIPQEAITEWLPSGGHARISESAIIITSQLDGKQHAKLFTIDATQYPKGIDIVTREKKEATGIYRFDQGRLVLCMVDPANGPRPTEFAAAAGTKRMLMVLQPKSKPATAAEPKPVVQPVPTASATPTVAASTVPAAKVVTDAELSAMLPGTWRFADEIGALLITITDDGNWSTVREVKQLQLFQTVFVRTVVSSGKWSIKNGTLKFLCTGSIHPDRVNHEMPFSIRSISKADLIFVDYMGRLGRAARVQ